LRLHLEYCFQCWASQYKRQEHTGASPAQDHNDDERTEASVIRGEAERTGTVQHGKEKAQVDLIHVYK